MKLYDVMRKEQTEEFTRREEQKYEPNNPPPSARFVITRKGFILILGSLLFLVILYVLGVNMVRAKVTIVERRIPFTLSNAELELTNQEKAGSERLSFQAMVVNTTITRQLYGSALTNSNTKATGTVVFFNEYSTSKQTVKKGTTLTATNGKKYITGEQTVVPGYTIVNKKRVAGTSPSVSITAIDNGESYNSPGTTLIVNGWSNASKTFYARSSAITGGDIGVSHTLTDSERKQAITTLESQLIERLKRETRAQIPKNFITFPELQFPIVDLNSFVLKGGSVSFPASMSGVMVSYLIPVDLLEQAIASKAISERSYPKVSVPNLGDLTFDLRSAVPTNPKVVPDSIIMTVSGQGTIITKVPVDKIKENLLGIPRRLFEESLAEITEISTAQFNLKPFWSPRFPLKWGRIEIITK